MSETKNWPVCPRCKADELASLAGAQDIEVCHGCGLTTKGAMTWSAYMLAEGFKWYGFDALRSMLLTFEQRRLAELFIKSSTTAVEMWAYLDELMRREV